MTDLEIIRGFRNAVLNIVEKEGQPATLGTAGGTVYYNDGVNDHADRVWVRMGAENQVLVVAKVGKKGLPNTPGLEVNVSKRHGSIYVDDWSLSSIADGATVPPGLTGHKHDYDTRNVVVSEYAGIPTGEDNVVVGYDAGANLEGPADKNVLIGAYAGTDLSGDDGNVFVGYKAGGAAAAAFPISPVFGSSNKISANDDMSSSDGWQAASGSQMIAVLSATKVVLGHVADSISGYTIEACVADISGDTITEGSWFTLDASYANINNPVTSSLIEIDSDTFLYSWIQYPSGSPYTIRSVAGTVSGTVITVGTQTGPSPGFGAANTIDCKSCRLSDTQAIVVASINNGSGSAWVVGVSGNVATYGSAAEFATLAHECTVAALSASKFIVFYKQSGDCYAKIGMVSGSTISFGNAYQVTVDLSNTNTNLGLTALSDSLAVFAWEEIDASPSNRYKYLCAASVVGTVITTGTPVTVGTTSSSYYSLYFSLDKINASTFILRYDLSGGTDDKEIAIGTVSGTTITLNGSGPWDSSSSYDDAAQVRYLGGGKAIIYGADESTLNTMDAVILSGLAGDLSSNTFVGIQAGENNPGAGGVCLGANAGDAETVSNRLHIHNASSGGGTAPLIYGEFDDGNIGINTTDMGAGTGVIGILNATLVPGSNPTGGGVLYVEGGALKYRGSSGTVTTIANA